MDIRRLELVTAALADPSAAWETALRAASEDQDAALDAATVIGALNRSRPGSAPLDLADRLAPVVHGADSDATQALGEAVRSMSRQVRKKLDDALPRDTQQNRARRTAFRKAAGLWPPVPLPMHSGKGHNLNTRLGCQAHGTCRYVSVEACGLRGYGHGVLAVVIFAEVRLGSACLGAVECLGEGVDGLVG
ncbi:hypothetical protein [Streptomyces sp. 1114.5]|uniref:hypothetical protein n=1 Tax=Streptomyces sp. 1114.5 TaxID=1938830 RepID=UPI000EAE5BA1|nr:hypothetical protein [Streptomyces sp. 1114.5]